MEIHGDPSPTHADLRSLAHDSTRFAQQSQKYYRFRSGPMSRIGQSVLFTPEESREGPSYLVYAPLLTHPDTVGVRTWTKRDQFEWRTWDIWPLDCPHKVGRRRRRCCNYVPPRWEMERSMKRRHKLISGDELDMEEDGIEDAARALSEEQILHEDHVVEDEDLIGGDENLQLIELTAEPSDMAYDMLSDMSSETGDSDWEVINVP